MQAPIAGVHDVNIVFEDSCNCSCFPCFRRPYSPKKEKEDQKTRELINEGSFFKIKFFGKTSTSLSSPS